MNLGVITRIGVRLALRLALRALRLGWRLAVVGSREALLRQALIAAGVAIGVMLLLLSLAIPVAVFRSADRSGWVSADAGTPASAPDRALFLSVGDYHNSDGTRILRAYVAALGPNPPVPPGLDRLPGPGEVAVSPAMRELLEATPDDQLDDRYPGRIVATIGDEALVHPDELVAIIGRTPEQLRDVRSEELETVRGFDAQLGGYAFYMVIAGSAATGTWFLLIPIVAFIIIATRVAATQREERLAAIHLAGASRLQTAVIAAVETGLAATAGSVLGWALFLPARHVLAANVTWLDGRFFVDDLLAPPQLLVLVLLGIPALATLIGVVTTMVALRGVHAGQLPGRRAHHPPPSARRAVPFAVGAAGLLIGVPLSAVAGKEILNPLWTLSSLTVIVGFVVMGPWLCLLAGRGFARVARRVPALIAARRVTADPRATFRAVGGVALAVFVVTSTASLVTVIPEEPYDGGLGVLRPGVVRVNTAGEPEEKIAPLLTEGAVVVRHDKIGGLVESCARFKRLVLASCPVAPGEFGTREQDGVDGSGGLVAQVYIPTDGTPEAENRVRTKAANLVPNAIIHTQGDRRDNDARFFVEAGRLMLVNWQFVAIIAACILTAGMIAGVVERRRSFALLRASGLHRWELYQVVFLETAAALLVTTTVGIVLGLGASWATALLNGTSWTWPGGDLLALIGGGVLASLALSAMSLPLLDAATRQQTVRYE